ncbi:MAG: leucine-rich repeat domain-containing protein, partial [Eubacteriales bacterium]
MKKILSVFLALVMVFSVSQLGTFKASADQSGDFTYFISDSKATITKYTGAGGSVTIPTALGLCPVTSIGNRAFYENSTISSLTIANTVTNIGFEAFSGCSGIPALTIPDSVATIEDSAFSYCTGINAINGIIIGNGVTNIGVSAFEGCSGTPKFTIPKSVSTIGNYAFNGCTSLTSIFVASNNANYSSQYGVLYNKAKTILIQYPHAKGGRLVIPNSVISFGSRAFYDSDHITSVSIPNSMTSIGVDAFSGCSKLTAVAISDSVTSIGNYAFSGCIALKKLTIPNSVTTIGNSAFFGCSVLTGVTIGSGVTAISNSAFSGCNLLTAAYFLGNAPTLGTDAFKNSASGFKLYYVNGNTSFTNPLSGYETTAFALLGLPVLSISTALPTNAPVTVTITSAAITKEYKLNEGHWTSYTAPITVYSNDIVYAKCYDASGNPSLVASTTINNIATEGFNYTVTNSAATITGYIGSGGAITIPKSLGGYPVTSIGNNAFQGCTTLTGVNTGSGVVIIGDNAFSGCSGLKGLEFGSSLTFIGLKAFLGCTGLTKVEIGDSITSLGINAFGDCSGLIGVSIGNGLSVISDYAFSNCIALSKVTIGSGVTNIAYGAFLNCESLTEVTIPIGVTNIGDYAFCNCTGLKRADIPSSVLSIGLNAFFGCSSLTGVTIGEKVNSIGNNAFDSCTGITAAYFYGNAPTTMGTKVFDSWVATFKVNYINGKSGFTSPWKGYNTAQFIPLATPTVSISPTLPLIENITVTITYPIIAIINEYKIDSGDWMTYTSPVKPSANCTVYARCTDVLGNTSSIGSLKVSNIAVDSFKYSVLNSAVTITGYTGAGGFVTIPDTLSGYPVTGIGNDAFATKPELTYVKVGRNVTNIGERAFQNCTGLTDVTIENKVAAIGRLAFDSCINLTAVTIPESVTAIDPYAFRNCSKLKAAYFLGNAPTTMSSNVFDNCAAAFTVYIRTGKTGFSSPWYGYILVSFSPLTAPTLSKTPNIVTIGNVTVTIDFPASANKKEYRLSTGGWTEYTSPIVLSANDTVLARYKDIDFKESETGSISVENISIGDYTYSVANSLATVKRYIGAGGVVTIPSTLGGYPVTGIGETAFSGNVGITGVTIPDSVLNIGVAAFNNCTGLINVTIGNNVTNISDQAFAGCSKLKTMNIPDSVIDIGYASFGNCIALTSVTFGSGVTFIDSYAFSGCTLLSSAYLFGAAPTNGIVVFSNCKAYYLGSKTGFLDQWTSSATEIYTPLATPILNISSYLPTSGSTSVTITYPAEATTKEYRLSEG